MIFFEKMLLGLQPFTNLRRQKEKEIGNKTKINNLKIEDYVHLFMSAMRKTSYE